MERESAFKTRLQDWSDFTATSRALKYSPQPPRERKSGSRFRSKPINRQLGPLTKRMTMNERPTISALIVDDEPLGRDLVRHMLGAHPDICVMGECSDGAKALAAIKRHEPALVFLDIQMPRV